MSIVAALRMAVRSHLRLPGMALALVLTVGIGVGGSIAVLAFVGGFASRPPQGASPEAVLAFVRTATLLGWAAGLVLVLTCASLAGLLLARATGRVRDTALRIAIGADRRTVAMLHLAEGTVVIVAGCVVAAAAAWWTASIFPLLFFAEDAEQVAMRPSVTWALWAGGAALAGLVVTGLLPVFAANHRDPSVVLRREAPGLSPALLKLRTRLVVAQAAGCALFVALAGVVRADVDRSLRSPRGAQLADLTVVRVAVDPARAPTVETGGTTRVIGAAQTFEAVGRQYLADVEARLRVLVKPDVPVWMSLVPGATAAATTFVVEPPLPRSRSILLDTTVFNAAAFPVEALTPVRGRAFTGYDGAATCRVGLLNASAADLYFGGGGLGAALEGAGGRMVQIVGVLPDAAGTVGRPTLYLHADQPGGPAAMPDALFYTAPVETAPGRATLAVVGVSDAYFQVMADPPIAGRAFVESDSAGACAVAVIGEAAAREALGGNALGGALIDASGGRTEIVGVTRTADLSVLQRSGAPWMLRPASQFYTPASAFLVPGSTALGRRSIEYEVRVVSGGTLRGRAVSLRDHLLMTALAPERIAATLMSVCAALALLLSVAGIHGAMSDYVARRRRELAVRLAMGAGAWHLVMEVVRQGLKLALSGTLIGVALAALAIPILGTQIGRSMLPSAFSVVGGILVMGLLVGVSCALPAWRAVAIDPKTLLQSE